MKIVLILHDVRSLYNIGSLLRTADGFGVSAIYSTGLTPFVTADEDHRPPHVRLRARRELHKTALGAENTLPPHHHKNIATLLKDLNADGYAVVGLEQGFKAKCVSSFKPAGDIALVVGSETVGLPEDIIKLLDSLIEIPMLGKKESFNVTIAASIALYELRREELSKV